MAGDVILCSVARLPMSESSGGRYHCRAQFRWIAVSACFTTSTSLKLINSFRLGNSSIRMTRWARRAMRRDFSSRNSIASGCWKRSSTRMIRNSQRASSSRPIRPSAIDFYAALDQADIRARARLARNPIDRDALFALTMSSGLKADYAGLIEKRNLASLHYTKEATAWAQQLLAVDPDCYDAHLATGVSQYIIGSMAAPIRWLVRLGGVSGDKQKGIADLQLTAERGHYLAPFARILLAIAYVREKDKARARELLVSLRNEFPQNPLFTQEIARLDTQISSNRP